MLYVFHGTDIKKSVEKAHSLINSLRQKKPDAAFVSIAADSWNSALLEENLGGQGLFSNKYIVFVDRITENSEAKEQLPEFVSAMQESANIFIVLEAKLNAELKKKIEKYAEKVVESDLPAGGPETTAAAKKKDFNIFALGDALGSRDPFKAWSVYREAVENGHEPESILGTLFWQAKSIAMAGLANTAAESGLNPFVFGKSKRYASNYSKNEINSLITNLITLYHDGHRGIRDLELATEKLLLNCGK